MNESVEQFCEVDGEFKSSVKNLIFIIDFFNWKT